VITGIQNILSVKIQNHFKNQSNQIPIKLLSVIIVTYRSNSIIDQCLDSIYLHNDMCESLEIIIVDNSPSDDPMCQRLKTKYKDLRILKNSSNGGYGQGNNIGAKLARGKYLLILNPDTVLVENIFKFSLLQFEEDRYLSIFGIQLVSADLKPSISFIYRKEFANILSNPLIKIFNKFDYFLSERMVPSGACMFIRKETFFKAGMFDENMFMYLEESYIAKSIKLVDHRNKIKYFSCKKIIHQEASSAFDLKKMSAIIKSQIYFLKKFNFSNEKNFRNLLIYVKIKLFIYKLFLNKKAHSSAKQELELIKKEYFNFKNV